MTTTPAREPIAPRLRPAQVGLRPDLEVHRHVFRGEVSYVLRDPLTLAVHKMSESDYQLCAKLSAETPLGEVFEQLVAEERLEQEDEESFYQFILSLHGSGFLSLPVPDNESLYRRRQQKIRARQRQKLMGFLFMQIPVVNPDGFLSRTKHLFRWVYSKWALAVWTLVVGGAMLLLLKNWGDFFTPIGDVFTPERLMGMWFSLVVLKVIHEFGHAYACKIFGGEVPEIGVYLIMGTPCAYCDCTSSWGFTQRLRRLIVVLAGVYVELFIAALAIYVWAMAPSASVRLIAFDIVVVAGVATVLANLNPLMRFDGYYILSDLLEIPNLRTTAQREAIALLKRAFVGVPMHESRFGLPMRAFLVLFGAMTAVYKITIVMGISALLATKFLYLGIGLAAFYGSMEIYRAGRNVGNYLIHSEEAKVHRYRAGVLATMIFAAAPAMVLLVPVPRPVKALGTVGLEREQVYYAPAEGFVASVGVRPGDQVARGGSIAELTSPGLESALRSAEHELARTELLSEALMPTDPASAAVHRREAEAAAARLARQREQLAGMDVSAVAGAVVLESLSSSDEGRYLMAGDPIARLGAGRWVVRGLVREAALSHAPIAEGDEIRFRSPSAPGETFVARVTRVGQLGSRAIRHETLTATGGGEIPISPVTGEANEPYFEIEALVENGQGLSYGLTGNILLGSYSEPVGVTIWRSGLRLLQKLEQN